MTDAEERLARLAAQRSGGGSRQAPAQVSRIIAAGLSSSMVLGLVAVMGWTATSSEVDQPATVSPPAVPATVAPTLATIPQTPVSTGALTPDPSAAAAPVAPAPTETAPAAAAPQPVVVELTVPAAQPAAGGGGAAATSSQSN